MKKFFRISAVIVISISLLVIGLPRILNSMGLNPEYEGQSVELINKRALIITTSHSVLSKSDEIKGKKVRIDGYLEEFSLSRKEADDLIMSAREIVYK